MKIPWPAYLSEFIGTALLILIGLSFVILNFGAGSPVAALLPDAGARRALTGFLFGATGAAIALSPVGKLSGAHINPVVTLAFRIHCKFTTRDAAGYIAAPLLLWGREGRSIAFGSTLPGNGYAVWFSLLGEVATTAALIVGLFAFLGHQRLRRFTPLLFPFLYAVMVYLEGPVSGTSTNPARSVGPSVVSGVWTGWWIYFVGPLLGMGLGLGIKKFSRLRRLRVRVAKIYHFHHDRYGIFHAKGNAPGES